MDFRMIFKELSLKGAYLINPAPIEDERGFFARTYCKETFKTHGLNPQLEQMSLSYNRKKGTLRGMHYQEAPHAEVKLVRCLKGAIYDVIIDLRPASSTYRHWVGIELTESSYSTLYIPEGFAHGFQTLQDNTEVFYQISAPFVPDASRGIRWNDPAFAITWPLDIAIISKKDQEYPFII